MSLSTNDGAHNGSSLLEQYINIATILEKETNKSILQVIAEKVTFLSSKPTQE